MKTKIILDEKRRTFIGAAVKGIDSKRRVITAYASTNAWDRYGERFESDAFKDGLVNYKKNPVILFGHDYWSPPIGKAIGFDFDAKGLILEQQFADTEKALEIFKLYEGGFMSAFSVGFRPMEIRYEERIKGSGEMGAVFVKAELLENSAVPVPANPEAVVLKGIGGRERSMNGEALRSLFELPYALRAPIRTEEEPEEEEKPKPKEGEKVAAPAAEPVAAPQPAPESAPEAEEAPKSLKAALGHLLTLGKVLKAKGKIEEDELRSLLVQATNLCRELVLGVGAEQLGGMSGEMSGEEIAALVREYELLSEKMQTMKDISEKDREEFLKLGSDIERMIEAQV